MDFDYKLPPPPPPLKFGSLGTYDSLSGIVRSPDLRFDGMRVGMKLPGGDRIITDMIGNDTGMRLGLLGDIKKPF